MRMNCFSSILLKHVTRHLVSVVRISKVGRSSVVGISKVVGVSSRPLSSVSFAFASMTTSTSSRGQRNNKVVLSGILKGNGQKFRERLGESNTKNGRIGFPKSSGKEVSPGIFKGSPQEFGLRVSQSLFQGVSSGFSQSHFEILRFDSLGESNLEEFGIGLIEGNLQEVRVSKSQGNS